MQKFHSFNEYKPDELDEFFFIYLAAQDAKLLESLRKNRQNGARLDSDELIAISIHLEGFITEYFSIEPQLENIKLEAEKHKNIYNIKRNFVQRFALQKYSDNILDEIDEIEQKFFAYTNLQANDFSGIDEYFLEIIGDSKKFDHIPEIIVQYAAIRVYSGKRSDIFARTTPLDFEHLISFSRDNCLISKQAELQNNQQIHRQGAPLQEANYCIKCHHNHRDSCSKGLSKDKQYQKNPLGNILEGCPLNVKISEMNELFANGNIISALAILMLDNPLSMLTGDRICNDCSKSCIFQKQDQVDIPSIESQIVASNLELDYGFEIYYLLSQWNPLDTEHKPSKTGTNILVVGSGPSGIALSYYLLKSGSKAIMIDGIKIEPLPEAYKKKTIKNYSEIKTLYNLMKPQGFGGVAEYGITDRWNKENLIIARLILERHKNFQLFGGVRFGSNINYDQAISLGFDHIALCCGSGYPKIEYMKNIEAGNIRSAADFLMSIGSGGISDENSNTNFFIGLPAYVVGGGLTAIDAAVEILHYYPKLIKKIAAKNPDNPNLSEVEKKQIKESIEIAALFAKEDQKAQLESRSPNYLQVINSLGGVSILYRKPIEQSPAYKINHTELDIALRSGVQILENAEITSIRKDLNNNITALEIQCGNHKFSREAKTLFFATGTEKMDKDAIIPSYAEKFSIYGDMDPKYSGSVVKAIASATDQWKSLVASCSQAQKTIDRISEYFIYQTEEVTKLSHDILEIKVKNKLIAENFKPGQFFKLQNFHNYSTLEKSCEPLAITGAYLDGDVISLVIQNVGMSSAKAFEIQRGERISLAGPLGEASKIESNSSYLLIGGGVGSAALLEYAKSLKSAGNKVIFACGYRKKTDLIYPEIIRKFSDYRIFACDETIGITPIENEISIKGNIIDALDHVDFTGIKNVFVVGSTGLMSAVALYLKDNPVKKIASINAPMQCMMGGVCGQCLILVEDEEKETKLVFICKHQEHSLNLDLMNNLKTRLAQNTILEK